MKKETKTMLFTLLGLPLLSAVMGYIIAIFNPINAYGQYTDPLFFAFSCWFWVQIISIGCYVFLVELGNTCEKVRNPKQR